MIGLDTNVLVRYLAQDEPTQAAVATRIIEQELTEQNPGFVGLVVLVELAWVLRRLYGATQTEIVQTIGDLLAARTLVIEQRDLVARALALCGHEGVGFADAVIAASAAAAGCTATVTFDRGAQRLGMTLVE
ncbi:MAG: PIN domain-containing protein [Gammaproteobacteria bacterium]